MSSNSRVAANSTGGNTYNGCLSEVWFSNTYLDFSNTTIRMQFISTDLLPVRLGTHGSLTTGIYPITYLRGNANNFWINSGTGGNYNVVTSLTECTTTPSIDNSFITYPNDDPAPNVPNGGGGNSSFIVATFIPVTTNAHISLGQFDKGAGSAANNSNILFFIGQVG